MTMTGLFPGPLRSSDLPRIRRQPVTIPEAFQFVSSGHHAIRLLLRSVGLKPGQRVAIPALICPTVVSAIQAEKLVPAYIDIDPDYFFMVFDRDPFHQLKPDALLLPHLYGCLHPQTREIMAFCREEKIPLIHDAAQSYGLTWDDQAIILQDQGGLYSFGPGKATTAATGALVWGIHETIAKTMQLDRPRRWDVYAHAFMKQRMGLATTFFMATHPTHQFPASCLQIKAAHVVMADFAVIETKRRKNWNRLQEMFGNELYGHLYGRAAYCKYVFHSETPWSMPENGAALPVRRVVPYPAAGVLPFYQKWRGYLYEISTERSIEEFQRLQT